MGWARGGAVRRGVGLAALSAVLVWGGTPPLASAAGAAGAAGASGQAFQHSCAYNSVNEAITGAGGTASAIGWLGNGQAVVTCLGGWFFVQEQYYRAFGFGIYDGGPTTWVDADGYLPAQITSFHRYGLSVAITEFADELTLNSQPFVAVYARVAITNPTAHAVNASPLASRGLIPLTSQGTLVPAYATVNHDYVIAVDNFNAPTSLPPASVLVAAGGFDQHFEHMRAFWDGELSKIAQVTVPDRQLMDAYRSGFIYTQIARSGVQLDTGVNNYQSEFSHDVIGILTNLITQGYDDDAHALLLEARNVVVQEGQYLDGVWTYPWPWAVYLLKTGDLAFVKANFANAPAHSGGLTIESAAHRIAAQRTGPNGIMLLTNDIDSNGYWTVDNYEALTGLAAYAYLAHAVGNASEEQWAKAEYASLLNSVNRTLTATINRYKLNYLPCSMLQPNTANRCSNPEDANWAAPFGFGRWAWDAARLGMPVSGPGVDLIDATYKYGFGRLVGKLPPNTYGGFPGDYYTTAYNAGTGSWGLASANYRSQGILGYEFMIANDQSGPYSWWESSQPPAPSPWIGTHPATGGGASPHAWGMANANKVLLDSIAVQNADGSLLVGRGVPDGWVAPGQSVAVSNFPTTMGRRVNLTITGGQHTVTLSLSGPAAGSEPVAFQLPVFVGNIASASAGTINETTGTVSLAAGQTSVTVRLG